jgi:hypothetical protein
MMLQKSYVIDRYCFRIDLVCRMHVTCANMARPPYTKKNAIATGSVFTWQATFEISVQEEKLQIICDLQTFVISNSDVYCLNTGVNGPSNNGRPDTPHHWLHSCNWVFLTWDTCGGLSSHLANPLPHCSFSVCLLPISGK